METKRDISIVDIGSNRSLVIACDVSGGIGPKIRDKIEVSGEMVGHYTTRVALMEVLAVGAEPISIIDTLSVEYNPTGKSIIKGIEKALEEVKFDKKMINGSTEDNIETDETGVGITVIGIIEKEKLKISCTKKGNILVSIGLPLVGKEVLECPEMRADIFDLQKLKEKKYINEIMVVGSKGIKYEAELIAEMSDLKVSYKQGLNLDIEKSAGPATVILVSLAQENLLKLRKDFSYKPVNKIAKFI
ncbi:MAG: AIR synthase related protein [Bacillota bacterium]